MAFVNKDVTKLETGTVVAIFNLANRSYQPWTQVQNNNNIAIVNLFALDAPPATSSSGSGGAFTWIG